jgi:hypothetical protein
MPSNRCNATLSSSKRQHSEFLAVAFFIAAFQRLRTDEVSQCVLVTLGLDARLAGNNGRLPISPNPRAVVVELRISEPTRAEQREG